MMQGKALVDPDWYRAKMYYTTDCVILLRIIDPFTKKEAYWEKK